MLDDAMPFLTGTDTIVFTDQTLFESQAEKIRTLKNDNGNASPTVYLANEESDDSQHHISYAAFVSLCESNNTIKTWY